jgi:5-(carboxyamino)imidazole ribonucleotide mutase
LFHKKLKGAVPPDIVASINPLFPAKQLTLDLFVFITIAGMSNALSGFTDAQTHCPVIACPPYSDKFAGADLYSSIRMPSGVAPLTILSPENAALAAAKILGLSNPDIQKHIIDFQDKKRKELEDADNALLNL